jgi:hypothetical protein
MKTYSIIAQAIITKEFTLEAESETDAINQAYDLFNPYSGESEKSYEQTFSVETERAE